MLYQTLRVSLKMYPQHYRGPRVAELWVSKALKILMMSQAFAWFLFKKLFSTLPESDGGIFNHEGTFGRGRLGVGDV